MAPLYNCPRKQLGLPAGSTYIDQGLTILFTILVTRLFLASVNLWNSKRAAEVAFELAHIVILLGVPAILQSDNKPEFTSHVTELQAVHVWPDLRLVHGKPRRPQSQGSADHANGDKTACSWLG